MFEENTGFRGKPKRSDGRVDEGEDRGGQELFSAVGVGYGDCLNCNDQIALIIGCNGKRLCVEDKEGGVIAA